MGHICCSTWCESVKMPTNFTVVPVEDNIASGQEGLAEGDATDDTVQELSGRPNSGEECHVGIHTHSFTRLAQAC